MNFAFRLGERQVTSLAKILEYSEDETLVEVKQQVLKKECMELWKIPVGARKVPYDQPENLCRTLLGKNLGKKVRFYSLKTIFNFFFSSKYN